MRRILEVEIAALTAAQRTSEDLQHLCDILADYKAGAEVVSGQREDHGESAVRTRQQHEYIFSFIEAGDAERVCII